MLHYIALAYQVNIVPRTEAQEALDDFLPSYNENVVQYQNYPLEPYEYLTTNDSRYPMSPYQQECYIDLPFIDDDEYGNNFVVGFAVEADSRYDALNALAYFLFQPSLPDKIEFEGFMFSEDNVAMQSIMGL